MSNENYEKWEAMDEEKREKLLKQMSVQCTFTAWELLYIHNSIRASIGVNIDVPESYAKVIVRLEKVLDECHFPFKPLFPNELRQKLAGGVT